MDAGIIIDQESVIVESNDNEDTLHSKIQIKEHLLFPRVMESIAKQILQNS